MPPQLATLVFVIGIIGLFLFDRDREARASKAIFLPLIWLCLTSSRSLTEWLQIIEFGRPLGGGDGQASAYAEGTPLDRNALIGLMVIALVVLIRRGRLVSLIRTNLPIVLFLLYGAVSAVWSDFPDVTIRRWFKAVGCVLMVMVVLSERDRDAATRRLFVWTGFVLIPLSVLLIKYYPTIGRTYIIADLSTWLLSPVGVTTHKNSLGGICQVYGIAFLWSFLAAYRDRQLPHRTRHLVAHGSALVMVVWLLVQANSVTAQSCLLLAAAFLFATNIRAVSRKQWLVHLLVVALVAAPFATLFLGVGGSALQGMGRDSTLTGRTDIWARVIALVDNRVVGTGFESFWLGKRLDAMQSYQRGLNETHNGYLEIWVSLGWIGVLLLAGLIVIGYRNIIASYRRNPDTGRFRLAYFVTVIVSSFTEAAFRTESISWIAFLLITMASPTLRQSVRSPRVTAATSEEARFEPVAVGSGSPQPAPEAASSSNSIPQPPSPLLRRL
jgi:exopolysaccharide production protein ExoQ